MLVKSLKPYLLQGLMFLGLAALGHLYPESGLQYAWTAIPAIAAVIGTGYGMYSQNKARQEQGELTKSQKDVFNQTLPHSQHFLSQSKDALTPALGYYTSALANPREATAPEQNRIGSLYAGQAANARNMYPRGGFGASYGESIRGQQRAANENVIQNARPNAAASLATMGSNLGSLGFQGYGLGAGILGNVFNQGLQARMMSFNQGAMMGQGLYNAYNSYLLNRALQDPGTGTGSTGTAGLYGKGSGNWVQDPYGGAAPTDVGW